MDKKTTFKQVPLMRRSGVAREERVEDTTTKKGPLKRKYIEVIEVKESDESTGTTRGVPAW